jgi:hypothetical protein
MRRQLSCAVLALAMIQPGLARAVVNPDISVIGQPLVTWTDQAGRPARKRPVFDAGETEFVFDAALNPYARGWFTAAFAEGEASIEEGFFSLLRGLPGGLALKGGKYRAGFGKFNLLHPHQVPFAERPGVLAAYLPGEEAFNETGADISWRLPLPGTWSVTASADVLQGDSFRIPREPSAAPADPLVLDPENGDAQAEPRAAWLGRLAAFAPVGDRSGVELGITATEGTNNVAAAARTRVWGGDVKAKLWTAPNAYLLVQGEYLRLHRQDASWNDLTGAYARNDIHPDGAYAFADFNWDRRYNVGASVESFEVPSAAGERQSAFGLFAGLSLMEETTAFRLDWRRIQPARAPGAIGDPDAIQQLTLRAIFSMGPHKAHQF